jgi:hypothetical protein
MHLKAIHFRYLQNSFWVSLDPLAHERQIFKGTENNTQRLFVLEATPGTEKNSDSVSGAWDFGLINEGYA